MAQSVPLPACCNSLLKAILYRTNLCIVSTEHSKEVQTSRAGFQTLQPPHSWSQSTSKRQKH